MKSIKALLSAAALIFISVPAFAAVTNLTLVGGCPHPENDPTCEASGNDSIENVSILLGLDASQVTQVFSGYTIDGLDGTDDDGIGALEADTGSWAITDSSITHLAFKANGYYILAEVNGLSGDWSTDITQWNPDYLTLTCPVGICASERLYEMGDFLNGGGGIAALSHVGAYSAIPVPAAVWLFGSGLGMLGWMRRRKTAV